MTDFFAKNLQWLLDQSGMGVYELAPKIGSEPSTIYRWINPEVGSLPRARTRVALAEIFGVDPSELVYRDLSLDPPQRVETPEPEPAPAEEPKTEKSSWKEPIPLVETSPRLRIATAFDDDFSVEPDEMTPQALDWLPPVPNKSLQEKRLVAAHCFDSSLAPELRRGDIVYIDFEFGDKTAIYQDGELVMCEYVNSKGTRCAGFRKLVLGEDQSDRYGKATNPDWPGQELVKIDVIYGKVVAIFRNLT